MESQNNNKVSNSFDGTTTAAAETTKNKAVVGMSSRTVSNCDLILRVLALVLTVTSAIVLGVDKQTKIVSIEIAPTLPPINVAAQAKWHYLSAFVYAVVTNIIASSYAAISTLIMLGTRNGKTTTPLAPIIAVVDVLMVGLLFSANGAALAIGLMGYKGNSHVRWNKVCNVFDKFCDQVGVSIGLSFFGSLAFVALVVLTVLTSHKRSACKMWT